MSAAVATKPSTDLCYLFAQASHVLTSELTAGLAELGISQRTYCVLSKAMSGELTQGQLADLALLDKTTMVVTLDELEELGYAERQPSSTDRRARIVSVTKTGRKVVAEADKVVAAIYDDVLAALPAGEGAALLDSLARLVDDRLSTPMPCKNPPWRKRTPR
jgi:MarR family transcriptional regulator, transcriptional regulator for hemolysin